MDGSLQEFVKKSIFDGLQKLPESMQNMFKLIYGRNNGKRSVEDAKLMSVDEIIKEIPADRLNWVMTQVENSFKKLN